MFSMRSMINLQPPISNLFHVLHVHGIALEDVGEGLRTDGDGTLHKLGDVVAAQELAVIVGVLAGQLERFRGMPILVNMGNVGTRVHPVVAAAAEDDPAAVARPRVVALGVR